MDAQPATYNSAEFNQTLSVNFENLLRIRDGEKHNLEKLEHVKTQINTLRILFNQKILL